MVLKKWKIEAASCTFTDCSSDCGNEHCSTATIASKKDQIDFVLSYKE